MVGQVLEPDGIEHLFGGRDPGKAHYRRPEAAGDDERAFVLRWLILYFEDDGRMRSPRAHRRTIMLDEVQHHLVRIVRKRSPGATP
jgi:hypothetical protein